MRSLIQFRVYKGKKYYIGEGVDLPIVTQGKTMDHTLSNLQDALRLYLKDEDPEKIGLSPCPAVLVNFELDMEYAKT